MNTQSNYVSRMNNYVNLDKYNIETQSGPPVPPSVPSMQFPTILEQNSIQSPEILTHGTNKNYPNVKKAYGNNCQQKYFVAKCPTNQFLRPFEPNGERPTPTPIKESFSYTPYKSAPSFDGKTPPGNYWETCKDSCSTTTENDTTYLTCSCDTGSSSLTSSTVTLNKPNPPVCGYYTLENSEGTSNWKWNFNRNTSENCCNKNCPCNPNPSSPSIVSSTVPNPPVCGNYTLENINGKLTWIWNFNGNTSSNCCNTNCPLPPYCEYQY